MSENQNAVIANAIEIIDLFGGIRPMSTKTGIPVTTIQGWKQRNAIPANRRNELIDAANRHGIRLADILMDIAGDKSDHSISEQEEKIIQKQKIQEAKLNPDCRPASNQTTLLAAGALILVAGICGVMFAMAPKVKTLTEQDLRIKELEQQIASMRDAQDNAVQPVLPEINMKLSSLEGQIGQLTEQAKTYAALAEDLKTGTVAQRLSTIENHVGGLVQQANIYGLQNIVQKFEAMQSSPEGMGQIKTVMAALSGATQGIQNPDDASSIFINLKNTNPQVAETFKDVAPEDMKAAVMLVGMAQLRSSLARDRQSFDQDLQILKMTIAKDNPELQAAIDKLAPQAKTGVLTPAGLSKELRGLTGEIVSASLTGENISIQDKAMARFSHVIKVEKNGQRISGTQTQIMIDEAQKKLDAGDVEGAVLLLQQVQGPAAEKTKPIIDAAQATMMASQVQQLVGQNLIQTLKGLGHKSAPYAVGGGGNGVQNILNQVQSIGSGIGAGQ